MKNSIVVIREMAVMALMIICFVVLIFSLASCGTVHKISSETENGITKHIEKSGGRNVEYITVKKVKYESENILQKCDR